MFNQVVIAGRLGRDPELRTTNSGTSVGNLSVAADSGFGDKKETYWSRCICFGKTAEFCAANLKKGDAVLVVGRLRERKWTDQAGQDRYTTEIIADRVQSLKSGGKESDNQERGRQQQESARPGKSDAEPLDDLDDEIPPVLTGQSHA